jgi:zinc D-Ala-D-Ala carboxypeptidase
MPILVKPGYSERFPKSMLVGSQEAVRRGINNDLPDELDPELRRLSWTLEFIEDELRRQISPNARLHVNSGFRSLALNTALKGAKDSQHMQGRAADLTCNLLTPLELCRFIAKVLVNFERVIHEFGAWCHVTIEKVAGLSDLRLRETAKKIPGLLPGTTKTAYIDGFFPL